MELSKTKPIEVILCMVVLFIIYKVWVEPPEEKQGSVQENTPSIIYYETNYGKNIVEETETNEVIVETTNTTTEETNTVKNEVNTVKTEVVFH